MADPVILQAWGFEGSEIDLTRAGFTRSFSGLGGTPDPTGEGIVTLFANSDGGYGGTQAFRLVHNTFTGGPRSLHFPVIPSSLGTPYGLDFSAYHDDSGSSTVGSLDIQFFLGGTAQWSVSFRTNSNVEIRRGDYSATLVATQVGVFTPVVDSRHRIQIKLIAHNSTGYCEVLIDGVAVYTLAVGDTQALSSPGWDRVIIGHRAADGNGWVIDDVIITDSSNGGLFVGEQRAHRRDVVAQISSTFTGHDDGAAGLSDSDELTYSEGLVIGEKQRYSATGTPFAPLRITAQVLHVCNFKRDGTITGLIPKLVIDDVEYPEDAITGIGVGTAVAVQRVVQLNPATGLEWTKEEVDASDLAFEVTG